MKGALWATDIFAKVVVMTTFATIINDALI